MNTIVVVDKNWGIGKNNDLLFHLPKDMQFFKKTTINKVVVMGSNTLLSFPKSKPLPKRFNIVLWPDGEKRDDCIIVQSLEELAKTLKNYNDKDIFIIGGAMFYRTMLPYCKTAYITKVKADGEAEVFFENLDKLPNWKLIAESETKKDGDFEFYFCTYENNDVKKFEF